MFDVVERKWGYDNNGVLASNTKIEDELLILSATPYNRTGAAVESKMFFNQGSFEFVAKTNATNGVCIAFWTFYYNNVDGDENTPNINHEIDIELYGKNNVIYSTYLKDIGEQSHVNSKVNYNINDSEYHTYRFDWYNGERVDFYIDGNLVCTIAENIPTHEMKVWIGLWCPAWSIDYDENGNPTPEIVEGEVFIMTVKSFRYVPFN
jgi:beta-glucanase (GH16 family)